MRIESKKGAGPVWFMVTMVKRKYAERAVLTREK
jgi:hypothetical protein